MLALSLSTTLIRLSSVCLRQNPAISPRRLLTSSLSPLDGMLPLVCIPEYPGLGITNKHKDTYRPPYYHRNAASELMGLIYGDYGGRSDAFKPGSVSFECGSMSRSFFIIHRSMLIF
jgi:hypothetical protein